jgi:hypothetical protein
MAIFRNEAPYLAEWIEYHLLAGVGYFYLSDNDSTDNGTAVVQPYVRLGVVKLEKLKGQRMQVPCYNAHLPELRRESYWVAVIDIDEFIVPVDSHSIPKALRPLEGAPGVTVNWVLYGSNGELTQREGLVIERFRAHSPWNYARNILVKTIVNPRMARGLGIHEHYYWRNRVSRAPNGRVNLRTQFWRQPVFAGLRLNHYWVKSREEFLAKRSRGANSQGRSPSYIRYLLKTSESDLKSFHDTVVNDTAILWAIPLVKANLRTRQGHVS